MNSYTPTCRQKGFEERPLHNRTHERVNDPAAVRTIASADLFRGAHEIVIDHAGALYRLKITRQGKLILNK